jgi:uncharacterized protein
MPDLVVRKLNLQREETWRYAGRVISSRPNAVIIEAFFNRADLPFHGIVFGRGDRFVEIYYTDRWYNIFEIHDRQDDHVKGWYCNITLPAEIRSDQIDYVDLALDLLVYPDGRQLVLDEDEFLELKLSLELETQARAALAALQQVMADPSSVFRSEANPD